jgi:hypothetical protein
MTIGVIVRRKCIADYLGVSCSTERRMEGRGLRVSRTKGRRRGSLVAAERADLDAWAEKIAQAVEAV